MSENVVYVVAKAPSAGHSKTRLCPPLTSEQAASLAAAFLKDTLALARRSGADVRLICRAAAERELLTPYVGGATVHVQDRPGLGPAMHSAFVYGARDGYRTVVVLGMDTPTLPASVLAEAFTSPADVTLGPSEDGGYYLLAAHRPHPTLFQDMTWGTSTVAQETLARCAALGLRTHLLTRWQDIDTPADLATLRHHLAGTPPDTAPHTREALHACTPQGSLTV